MASPNYNGKYQKLFPNTMSTNALMTIYILHVLAEDGGFLYGKEIIDKIRDRFHGVVKPSHGLMYPIMRNLEEAGLLEAHQDGNQNVRNVRRFFRITLEGREALHAEAEKFKPVFLQSYMFFSGAMKDLYSIGEQQELVTH